MIPLSLKAINGKMSRKIAMAFCSLSRLRPQQNGSASPKTPALALRLQAPDKTEMPETAARSKTLDSLRHLSSTARR